MHVYIRRLSHSYKAAEEKGPLKETKKTKGRAHTITQSFGFQKDFQNPSTFSVNRDWVSTP